MHHNYLWKEILIINKDILGNKIKNLEGNLDCDIIFRTKVNSLSRSYILRPDVVKDDTHNYKGMIIRNL